MKLARSAVQECRGAQRSVMCQQQMCGESSRGRQGRVIRLCNSNVRRWEYKKKVDKECSHGSKECLATD
jgi:hypothetical protein